MATAKQAATVFYEDVENGYTEDWDPSTGWTCKRKVQIDWSYMNDFPALICGEHKRVGNTYGVGSIHRTIPEFNPMRTSCYATSIRLVQTIGRPVQEGGNGGAIVGNARFNFLNTNESVPGKAIYEIIYTKPPYEVGTTGPIPNGGTELDRYVERRKTFSVESLQIPGTAFKWSSDSKPVMEPVAKLFPTIQLEYIWHLVPDIATPDPTNSNPIPPVAFLAIGCVNQAVFDGSYSAQTVLFLAPHVVPTADCRETRCFNITYQFIYRPTGWNKYLRRNAAAAPSFATVVDRATGTESPYATYDFSLLFI